jgi:putative spermidine/putrescine transport system ATP-binding protein
MTLLGPSGSGKTTTLSIIAGFDAPTSGDILLHEQSIRQVPPHRRNIGMVFQRYTLFPHMTVFHNVAFPLTVRRRPRSDIAAAVQRALALVQLGDLGDRKPNQLSGGQQQRVALARALVYEPGILVMDEPLGALDKKLREEIQVEIRRTSARVSNSRRSLAEDNIICSPCRRRRAPHGEQPDGDSRAQRTS